MDRLPVYYGGGFNDSDCEDWLDWYNFNAPVGCCVDLPDKGEDRLPNAMGSAVMMEGEVAQPAHVQQDLLATSVPVMDNEITVPVAGNGAPIMTESADPRNTFETVHGMPVYYGGDLNDSDHETPGDNDYDTADPGITLKLYMGCRSIMEEILMIWFVRPRGIMIMTPGRTGVILTFGTATIIFPRTTRRPSCLS